MSEIKVNSIKGVGASTAAITVNNTDGTCTANVTNNLSNRNKIYNGKMAVAQRSQSVSSITATGIYTCDRWHTTITTCGTWTQSQSTDVPTGEGFSKSLKMDCTTADASLAAGDRIFISQRFEGQDLQDFCKGTSSAKQYTLSFYVKSAKTGTHVVELLDHDSAFRHVCGTYTINSADTWEKKTITFPADTTGAFGDDNAKSLEVQWYLAAGSTYQSGTLATSWASVTNGNRATGQVNVADNTANNWYLTGVQLEVGSVATDFEHLSFADELRRCQRYYWKIAQNTYRRINGYKRSDGNSHWEIHCPVPMRTAPSPTLLVSGTFTNFNTNFNTTQSSPTVGEWNTDTGQGLLEVSSTWSSTNVSIPSWEGYSIEFSAEL
jgi:hypothetical protein